MLKYGLSSICRGEIRMIAINSQFDSGNIECVSCKSADDIQLNIRVDNESHFYQWFYFRLTGGSNSNCRMRILNAGQSAYADGWQDYRAVASYDLQTWFRVPTHFADGELVIEHQPVFDSVYYAYFAPYPTSRHAALIADCQNYTQVRYEQLGLTLDGQAMDMLVVGEPADGKKVCWVFARQHPGETMAEWWMEGFLARLLDEDDAQARTLLQQAVFYVVPNMNPDGSRRGHLRTNAAGMNLNREWKDASMEKSPEVYLVRQKMAETGVDFALDVHGDEALPYNFIAGAEGIEGWSDRLAGLQQSFCDAYQQANPDFQQQYGYPLDKPNSSDLRKATDYIAQTHNCLSMTLEMPFKDNANLPNEESGWSPERCAQLGASVLYPLARVLSDL